MQIDALERKQAAEDPSRLFLSDWHLQVAAIAWLVAVIWILR